MPGCDAWSSRRLSSALRRMPLSTGQIRQHRVGEHRRTPGVPRGAPGSAEAPGWRHQVSRQAPPRGRPPARRRTTDPKVPSETACKLRVRQPHPFEHFQVAFRFGQPAAARQALGAAVPAIDRRLDVEKRAVEASRESRAKNSQSSKIFMRSVKRSDANASAGRSPSSEAPTPHR